MFKLIQIVLNSVRLGDQHFHMPNFFNNFFSVIKTMNLQKLEKGQILHSHIFFFSMCFTNCFKS